MALRTRLRRRWTAWSAGVLLLAASAANLGLTTAAYIARDRAMPTLAAFDGAWWERWFVETQDSRLTAQAGRLASTPRSPNRSRGSI